VSTATADNDILSELESAASVPPPSDGVAAEAALLNESIDGTNLDNTVPADKYLVKIVEVTAKKSEVREERDPKNPGAPPVRKGGNLYFNLKLQILQGKHAGRVVWDMVMLTGQGSSRMALLASRLGFYDKDAKVLTGFGTPTPTLAQIKARLMNQVVGIETEIETGRKWREQTQPDKSKVVFNGYLDPSEVGGAALASGEMPGWS